ncbi:MAG: aminotransferase class I/II-fold pyridoxal phosphate-dependent enzyme [Bacteroidetes bacterium]|nr:aminotransferase class I/II-fold pyridoxal phosphate-dependent enzyme [Bacteroidota bacterium]
MDTSFILNHLGEERDEYYGSVAPPIFQTTNFCFKTVAEMRQKLTKELETPFYSRGYNPTVAMLRKKIAALEKAEDALVFSSGSAAVAAAVMSVVKGGDHVVCVQKPYSWTNNLLSKYLAKYGVTHTFVSGGEAADFEKAILPNTKLIYLESPNSLTFELQDIEAISKLAKSKGITTIIDNSYNSPINQNPITLGVDLVVHSGSKYINGHSDVVCGVVCGSNERIMKMMAEEYMTIGSVISAQDAGLVLRGLRTIELRVNQSAVSAKKVADFLEKHPKIKHLNYPFSSKNPQLELAKKQMKQGGGLLSIVIDATDVAGVEGFCDNLKRFIMATSWGGYESLLFPLCALAASKSFENPLPWNMVRLYIGLEDADLLIEDLKQALDKV